MTKVINMFAGPGAGKSTTAAGLFFEMKCAGHKVELVTEYAKELAYRGLLGSRLFANAFTMHDVQRERMEALRGQVDFIVTDSPLYKDIFYAHHSLSGSNLTEFKADAARNFDSWTNFNVFIERSKPYAAYGRRESEESARAVCTKMKLDLSTMIDLSVSGDRYAPKIILEHITERGLFAG